MSNLEPPDHRDVFDRLAGVPGANQLRYLTLSDRLVDAKLSVTMFAPGSLEPLTARVLEELQDGEPLHFEKLAAKFGLTRGAPSRVLAEIIAALERSHAITIAPAADGGIVVQRLMPSKSLAVRMFFRLQTVQFVPAARHVAQKIWAQNLLQFAKFQRNNRKISVWEPPFPELYEPTALKSAIKSAFETSYRFRFDRNDGANEFRDEMLQRSQLLPTQGHVAKADVLETNRLPLVVYHRCYVHPKGSLGGNEWNVIVRRYPSGGEQTAYTQYLTSRCKNPEFCRELIDRARARFY